MILSKLQNQDKLYSQLAGLFYLLIAILGGISIGVIPTEIVVNDNSTLTLINLKKHQTLFLAGVAGDIFVLVFELVLTVMLFKYHSLVTVESFVKGNAVNL